MQIDVVLEVEADDPLIAIDFLVDNLELSKSKLKDMMNKGAVWHVDQKQQRRRLRRAMSDIKVGDQIEVFYDDELLAIRPPLPRLVHDEAHYSVWDKPAGLLCEGNDWGDHASLIRMVELFFKPRRDVFLVHRLDREASGLMIVAHSRKAALLLTELFERGDSITQRFRVDVQGDAPESGTIDMPIDGHPATTRYQKVKYEAHPDRSTLDAWKEVGPKHQIRRHLESIGYPIVGDTIYGPDNKQAEVMRLRAVEMTFECPITLKTQRFSLMSQSD